MNNKMSGETCDSTLNVSEFLPLKMDSLTPEIIRKAEKELNETPEKKQEALKELKHLIKAEDNFQPFMEDNFLMHFLRARKFNANLAMKTLKNYYTYKVRYSRMLTDILPSEIEHILDMDLITVMPHRDNDGRSIAIGKVGSTDLNKVTIEEMMATSFIILEILLQSEATQISGVVLLGDFKGLSLRLARQLATPARIYRSVKAIQDCFPIRIKEVHVVNEPFYVSMFFNIAKTFLSEKMKNRIQFHGKDVQSLHKTIRPELLPEEFGGQQGPMDCKSLTKEVLNAEYYFSKLFMCGFQEKRAQYIRRRNSTAIGLYQ